MKIDSNLCASCERTVMSTLHQPFRWQIVVRISNFIIGFIVGAIIVRAFSLQTSSIAFRSTQCVRHSKQQLDAGVYFRSLAPSHWKF